MKKDERLYHLFIDLSFEDEENNSEESDGSDLSSDSNEEPERKEAEGGEVIRKGLIARIRRVP
jgi:hypothetical protein